MAENIEKHSKKYKLFGWLLILSWKSTGNTKVWKFLGLPLLKIRKKDNDEAYKYYFCGIPVMKMKQRYVAKRGR